MELDNYSLSIPEGRETSDGYVHLAHGTQYTIELKNDRWTRADADVSIDGRSVGLWRIPLQKSIRLERPVHDTGRFTFYRVGSAEAVKAQISRSDATGLIQVVFKPEKSNFRLGAPQTRTMAGGTGLSGKSEQKFVAAETLDYDEARFVTINLRLVTTKDEPKPLFAKATPIPPPIR